MSSDLKRISVDPDDAAFLRDVCDELGLDQAKAVARFCRKSSPETAAVYDRRQRVRQGGG
jgi:hypothetical protein